MSGNSTNADVNGVTIVTAISVGSFFGLIFLCSCFGFLYYCIPVVFGKDVRESPRPCVQQNPILVSVDEDPSNPPNPSDRPK